MKLFQWIKRKLAPPLMPPCTRCGGTLDLVESGYAGHECWGETWRCRDCDLPFVVIGP